MHVDIAGAVGDRDIRRVADGEGAVEVGGMGRDGGHCEDGWECKGSDSGEDAGGHWWLL